MATFPKFDKVPVCDHVCQARKKADEAIGGISHECEVGWKAGVTRLFMRTMAKSGGYSHKGLAHI